MKIHQTAVVSSKAELGADVEVGPYCVIDAGVHIGAGTRLHAHAVITGDTHLGERCEIFPFTSIGAVPQDLKYAGEESSTHIGDRTVIRENVTIHKGTSGGCMETRIGKDCFIMACAHVAHDCILGDNVILANAVLLAGHCELGDYVFMGGNSVCQQYLKIGTHAFITGSSGLASHIPPYVSVFGIPAVWTGINIIGLRRRGFDNKQINALRKFYNTFFKMQGTAQERVEKLEKEFSNETSSITDEALGFIKSSFDGRHAILQSRR